MLFILVIILVGGFLAYRFLMNHASETSQQRSSYQPKKKATLDFENMSDEELKAIAYGNHRSAPDYSHFGNEVNRLKKVHASYNPNNEEEYNYRNKKEKEKADKARKRREKQKNKIAELEAEEMFHEKRSKRKQKQK